MIRHISSIAEIVDDINKTVQFYRDVLGLEVDHEPGSGYAVVKVEGTLHFGIWGRKNAAEMTYGDENKVDRIPLGFTIGFEVDSVEDAGKEIENKGCHLEQAKKTEPWGQVTSRFFSSNGAFCEFSELPGARKIVQPMIAED